MNHEEIRAQSRNLISELEFCVFDLETTGGNQEYDQIIEVGLVKIKNLEITDEKQYLIRPNIPIPEFIQQLTKINPSDLEDCPSIEETIDEIVEFMGSSVLVAHNTSFDVPFLNSVLRRLGREELENKVVCTNLMTKYLIPSIMNSNLSYMSELFDIKHDMAHRAIEDARATAKLLLCYLSAFIEKGIKKVNQIYYPRNKFELDRGNFVREDGVDHVIEKISQTNCPMTLLFKGENGLLLKSLPVESFSKSESYIVSEINRLEWTTVTVRLFGSFLDAFLFFTIHFKKLPETEQELVLEFLTENHGRIPYNVLKNYDFIFARHLVKNQLIVFPLSNFGNKQNLIFRFPSHKRKLNQYLNAQVKRMEKKNNKRKFQIEPPLLEIISSHLENDLKAEENTYYLIDKNKVTTDSKKLLKSIAQFQEKTVEFLDFPKKHL